MNNTRRKEIAGISVRIENALSILNDALADLESIKDEEQEYLDNMPENLQQSDKGQVAEEAVNNLDQAVDTVQEVIDSLDEVNGWLDDAQG